jgi:hypothetical protein
VSREVGLATDHGEKRDLPSACAQPVYYLADAVLRFPAVSKRNRNGVGDDGQSHQEPEQLARNC